MIDACTCHSGHNNGRKVVDVKSNVSQIIVYRMTCAKVPGERMFGLTYIYTSDGFLHILHITAVNPIYVLYQTDSPIIVDRRIRRVVWFVLARSCGCNYIA